MDKELFDDIERKLYRYYSKDEHERSLKQRLEILDNRIEQ
ncbi:hypothetical protein UT300007_17290 [Clostridium sp. CTA-7]